MRKLNYVKVGKIILMALICLHFFSCSKVEEEQILLTNEANVNALANVSMAAAANDVVIRPTYDGTTFLRNPLNGWVLYAGADDPAWWDKLYNVPGLGQVKALDYASACYVRTSWNKLNPADGFTLGVIQIRP